LVVEMASILEAMLSTPDFDTEEETDEHLEKLYKQLAAERTMHDPTIVAKFHECLERANTPKDWESLVRYPYIEGKPAHLHKGKNLPSSWEPGHELKRDEDGGIMWHCVFVEPCDYFGHELYCHHSVELWPDGKLVGESYRSGTGKIDIQDVNRILEKWSASMDQKKGQYWDNVDE
jgi:hypothetical protein